MKRLNDKIVLYLHKYMYPITLECFVRKYFLFHLFLWKIQTTFFYYVSCPICVMFTVRKKNTQIGLHTDQLNSNLAKRSKLVDNRRFSVIQFDLFASFFFLFTMTFLFTILFNSREKKERKKRYYADINLSMSVIIQIK